MTDQPDASSAPSVVDEIVKHVHIEGGTAFVGLSDWARILHLFAQLADSQAEVQRLREVVEDAREFASEGHRDNCRVAYRHCTCSYADLAASLARLDGAAPGETESTGDQKRYLPWAEAGGPNECKHGYAEGIPCPRCDDAARHDNAQQEGVEG